MIHNNICIKRFMQITITGSMMFLVFLLNSCCNKPEEM
uniref:Uncharacterized protein n=1 Tax=Rhizophora mucronata TaxID=61149 RepID=A0A2P2NII6_RHIMU